MNVRCNDRPCPAALVCGTRPGGRGESAWIHIGAGRRTDRARAGQPACRRETARLPPPAGPRAGRRTTAQTGGRAYGEAVGRGGRRSRAVGGGGSFPQDDLLAGLSVVNSRTASSMSARPCAFGRHLRGTTVPGVEDLQKKWGERPFDPEFGRGCAGGGQAVRDCSHRGPAIGRSPVIGPGGVVRCHHHLPAGRAGPLLPPWNRRALSVADGLNVVSIVGPTGCGKSTLLNVAAGLLQPSGGKAEIFGAPLTGLNRQSGYLFQADSLFPWKTSIQNVADRP